MALYPEENDSYLFNDQGYEEEDIEQKKRLRKLIEDRLERQKLKKELEDDFEDFDELDEFDWDEEEK